MYYIYIIPKDKMFSTVSPEPKFPVGRGPVPSPVRGPVPSPVRGPEDSFVKNLQNFKKKEILSFIKYIAEDKDLSTHFEKWNSTQKNNVDLDISRDEESDPRESVLKDIFCNSDGNSHKHILMRHHYSLSSRRSGTIYDKHTYMQFMQKSNAQNIISTNEMGIPNPPEAWFHSLGGSVDYVNGTLHFPMVMPAGSVDLCSYTIRRQKLSGAHFLFLAAQVAAEQNTEICDESLCHLIDILLGKKYFDSKEYTPRKITVAQTKELLHAWVSVYVYEKKEYIPILNYYLYAGYVVSITNKHGGIHEHL